MLKVDNLLTAGVFLPFISHVFCGAVYSKHRGTYKADQFMNILLKLATFKMDEILKHGHTMKKYFAYEIILNLYVPCITDL